MVITIFSFFFKVFFILFDILKDFFLIFQINFLNNEAYWFSNITNSLGLSVNNFFSMWFFGLVTADSWFVYFIPNFNDFFLESSFLFNFKEFILNFVLN